MHITHACESIYAVLTLSSSGIVKGTRRKSIVGLVMFFTFLCFADQPNGKVHVPNARDVNWSRHSPFSGPTLNPWMASHCPYKTEKMKEKRARVLPQHWWILQKPLCMGGGWAHKDLFWGGDCGLQDWHWTQQQHPWPQPPPESMHNWTPSWSLNSDCQFYLWSSSAHNRLDNKATVPLSPRNVRRLCHSLSSGPRLTWSRHALTKWKRVNVRSCVFKKCWSFWSSLQYN